MKKKAMTTSLLLMWILYYYSLGINLSENELNVFIEAAVRELNQVKTEARSA